MFVLFWFHLVSRMFDLAYFRAFFAGVPWPHAAHGHRQTFISRHAGPRIRCSCTQMLVPSSFDQSALGCRSITYIYSKPFGFSLNYVLQGILHCLLFVPTVRNPQQQFTATIHNSNL
jgi:hypothetical protein